ncbi:uncharacterized protein F4822DRAFT_420894 [Hypoxylon trugodes]|uniref:uncharacterized protein n=1 Tax=Hypoxylon trugodes TaxID=326681 RepID=UPI002196E813|nr:uncharacterized protein F4822DRAFT_420894 [Hypoxylon trugodes]KAI1383521.1 hypothetical protein F4822DRAFT_420894 [Hypoxylon trugodes]
MASQSPSFPQFSKLPLELRDMIWGYALPEPRVYEVLDSPSSKQTQTSPSGRLMFADVRNEPPPSIARVCRDARQAVLRRYKPIAFSGTVKHLDLRRDIILLDSYLQVKRLLKVIRLLSQIEPIRRSATRLALGTSWGLHTGLHLRMFHRSVQTKRNMARFLEYVSKFRQLDTIILVVYQRSAFGLRLRCCGSGPGSGLSPSNQHQHHQHQTQYPNQRGLPWRHYDLYESYHFNFNVNFNFDNYWLRRPYQSRLVRYDPEDDNRTEMEKAQIPLPRHSKQCAHDPQPRGYQVHDLKGTFESWLRKFAEDETLGPSLKVPGLETATLTWIYTGVRNGGFY